MVLVRNAIQYTGQRLSFAIVKCLKSLLHLQNTAFGKSDLEIFTCRVFKMMLVVS